MEDVISRCIRNERIAQNYLFHRYAPLFKSICIRYVGSPEVAEDILMKAFYKIFSRIKSYQQKGSFEGWMKRIVVNECLMELRKTKNLALTVPLSEADHHYELNFHDQLEYREVIDLLNELPVGYRTVFNLYVIEGYKHREIAEMLNISINTSKSQLILAKRKLQKLIKKKWTYRIA